MKIDHKLIWHVSFLSFAFAVGYFLGGNLLMSFRLNSLSDFHVYYYIPKAVLTLSRPEYPYTNFVPIHPYFFPPGSFVLFRPLLLLPFYKAKIFWSIFNAILFIGSAYMINEILKGTKITLLLILLLGLVFFPFKFTIWDGQFNIVLLFIYSFGLFSFIRDKNLLGGISLGIGSITKISPFLIVLYSLWKKKRKIGIVSILTIVVLSAFAEIKIDRGINYYYVRHVVKHIANQASVPSWRDQSLLGFIKRIDLFFGEYTIAGFSVSQNEIRSLISYMIVGIVIMIFLYLDVKHKKHKLDLILSYLILVCVGVMGTGLAWYHQYTMLLLPIWGLMLISVLWLKKPYNFVFSAFSVLSYLLINQNLEGKTHGFFQLNMFAGGVLLTILLFILKAKQGNLLRKSASDILRCLKVQEISFAIMLLIFGAGTIVGLKPIVLVDTLKQYRDEARVGQINYIGNVLREKDISYDIGKADSFTRTEKLDEGYILFSKNEHNRVRKKMSVLYLDPINNERYNYRFESTDGTHFVLKAKLESNAYKNEFGEYYKYTNY